MPRKSSLPRPRSQLPKSRVERFASFGFRHSLVTANSEFYMWLDSLEESLSEQSVGSRVNDPSRTSLKIVERYGLAKASRRERYKISGSAIGAIKQDVRIGLGELGLTANGVSVVFDKVVPVGSPRSNGERRKFALAASLESDSYEILFEENQICASAMARRGVPRVRYPDSEWIPHLTIVSAHENPHKIGMVTEESLKGHGPITVNLRPLDYYSDYIEPMV